MQGLDIHDVPQARVQRGKQVPAAQLRVSPRAHLYPVTQKREEMAISLSLEAQVPTESLFAIALGRASY